MCVYFVCKAVNSLGKCGLDQHKCFDGLIRSPHSGSHMHFLNVIMIQREENACLLIIHKNMIYNVNSSRHCERPSNEATQCNQGFDESPPHSLGQLETTPADSVTPVESTAMTLSIIYPSGSTLWLIGVCGWVCLHLSCTLTLIKVVTQFPGNLYSVFSKPCSSNYIFAPFIYLFIFTIKATAEQEAFAVNILGAVKEFSRMVVCSSVCSCFLPLSPRGLTLVRQRSVPPVINTFTARKAAVDRQRQATDEKIAANWRHWSNSPSAHRDRGKRLHG